MPKRIGAKKGHKCSAREFDRYCDKCWERLLKIRGLEMGRAEHSGTTTYIPQLELESSRSLPDGSDADSHAGECNCEICRRKRKEETRLLRVITGDSEATTERAAWQLSVPVSLMAADHLDRLASDFSITFALEKSTRRRKNKKEQLSAESTV